MAQCTAITSILKSCDNNMGGIREIWLWDMEDVLSSTFDQTTTYTWTAYALNNEPSQI